MKEANEKQIEMKTGTMIAVFFVVYGALGAFLGYLAYMVNPDIHWAYGIVAMLAIGAIVVALSTGTIKRDIDRIGAIAEQQSGRYPTLEHMVSDLAMKAGSPNQQRLW